MRALLLLLCLVAGQALGATRYICQTGQGTQDGSSAANCYNGYAAAWSSAAIGAGDTVYIVGDITSATNTIGASGTAGNPIVFDCMPPGQAYKGKMRTTSTSSAWLSDDKEYITVQNCKFEGNPSNLNQTSSLRFVTRSATRTGITVQHNDMSNAYATSAVVHPCLVTDTDVIATHRFVDVTIVGNDFHECGIGAPTQNSDGATLNAVTSGLVVTDNRAWGNNTDGLDIPGGGAILVERNLLYNNGFDGAKIHCGSTAISGGRISSNISFGNGIYAYTMQDFASTTVANNIGIVRTTSVTPFNGGTPTLNAVIIQAANPGTCTQTGNTFVNNDFESLYASGVVRVASVSKAAFESGNTWNGNNVRQTGSGSTVIDFTTDSANNVTVSNFATWQTSHAKDKRSDPGWIGGSTPTTAGGFKLSLSSALLNAGVTVWPVKDYLGCIFELGSPNIGAYSNCAGDPAPTRTAR